MSSRISTPEPRNAMHSPRPTVEDDDPNSEFSIRSDTEPWASPPPYSASDPSPTHDMPFDIAALLDDAADLEHAPKIYLRGDAHIMDNGGTLGSVVLIVQSYQRDNALTFFLPTICNPERIPLSLPRGWMDIIHGPRGEAVRLVRTQRYLLLEIFAIFHAYASGLPNLERAHFSAFSEHLLEAAEVLHPFERAERILRRITLWGRACMPRAVYKDPIIPFAATTASVYDLDAVSFAVKHVLLSSRAQWLRNLPARARPFWVGDDGEDDDDTPELVPIE
ncbi:hypothetical protein K466DRAFT_569120 [Polyporus arcularius HHB13444]|uniref:Uncharacterized protein n=1 Tax=Polyporus arcularius HHB13444 TaxID=1314778 RepID=A0A5C3NUX6_9APHY|nr:hypothetical protein K466DRAFT_569120 [Polyporus arcularius HHB13444]